MTPGSFDPDTCRELVGDARVRKLEAAGRAAADADGPAPERKPESGSYWGKVQDEAAYRIELAAYHKRMERRLRMAP